MIDVADAIDEEARNISLIRRAAGAYDDSGNWVGGAETTTTIRAAVQPATGTTLKDLPEGLRDEAEWMVWSRSELRFEDRISFNGDRFRLIHVWPRADGGFYKAAAGLLADDQ